MAIISLSLMNIFLALNLRFPEDTAFQGSTFSNHRLLYAYLWVILGSILMTETRLFQAIFGTTSLTVQQWEICLIPGVVLLIVGELFKVTLRYSERHSQGAV
jgi:P-type Ca2+ transporter type 2C